MRDKADGEHLDRLVAIGGEVLGGNADNEAAPQADSNAEEHVPVLDDAVGLVGEDAGELGRQRVVADSEHHLRNCMHAHVPVLQLACGVQIAPMTDPNTRTILHFDFAACIMHLFSSAAK